MTEKEKAKKPVKKAAPKKKAVAKESAPKEAAPKAPAAEKKVVKPKVVSEVVRGNRRERQGVVISDKMQKTIVVEVTRLIPHPIYGRVIKRKSKAVAHDEKEAAKIGDTVRITEVKPLSKTKRWNLVEVVKK